MGRRSVGKPGGVVFVLLYDSSFLFYFDVVCEMCRSNHIQSLRLEGTERWHCARTISGGHYPPRLVPEDTFLSVTGHSESATHTPHTHQVNLCL